MIWLFHFEGHDLQTINQSILKIKSFPHHTLKEKIEQYEQY